jgi:hypothetical protein
MFVPLIEGVPKGRGRFAAATFILVGNNVIAITGTKVQHLKK